MVARRKDPLTEEECAALVDGQSTLEYLAKRFFCSQETIKRAQAAVRVNEPVVYLFKLTALARGGKPRKKYSKWDSPIEGMLDQPLGCDAVRACDEHLEDLRRVYGTKAP